MAQTSNNQKAISSGIWFTISNFIVRSIGFITTPIFTRLLSKAEFGDFNNFTTWTGIILILTSLNLEASLIRARFDYEEDLDAYSLSMISLSALSTLIFFAFFNIFIEPLEQALAMNKIEIRAMFIYLLFYPAVAIFQNVERYKYKYKWTVFTSMTISIGSSLLSVVLVLTWENKLLARITGYILPVAIIGVVLWVYYLVIGKKIRIIYWKYALPFTLPFIPHLLSMYLLGSMNKVMIKQICGSEELALYSLAYTVGTLITVLVTSMNNAYSPWLGEQLSKKNYESIKKFSIPYILFFTYFACGVALITPEILYIMGGTSYMNAKYVMPPITAGCLMQFIYCMYVNVEQYEKKTIGMAMASVIAATLNYFANLFLIKRFGYIAAGYTTYFGYFILLLMHMYLVKKIGKSHVYDNKKTILIAVLASAIVLATNLILNLILVRYILAVCYGVIGVLIIIRYKSQILKFLKRN